VLNAAPTWAYSRMVPIDRLLRFAVAIPGAAQNPQPSVLFMIGRPVALAGSRDGHGRWQRGDV
jgi:hypothetical protein